MILFFSEKCFSRVLISLSFPTCTASKEQKLVLLKRSSSFLCKCKSYFSELSKTFEKWINFPSWKCKSFLLDFFRLFLFIPKKFFLLLEKNCFMVFFLECTELLLPSPKPTWYLMELDKISRLNSSNSASTRRDLNFMEQINWKFKMP